MTGYKLNPDTSYVAGIINGIHKKEGHCPCRIARDETTLCPCDEFIGQGVCACRLFIPAGAE